jgi:hypothetical protein
MPDDYTLNFNRIKEQYKSRGLGDYLLKSLEDLKEIHGVDFTTIPGFNTIDDDNKKLYEKFLVRFFNDWQIDIRDKIKPIEIHFVQDIEYYVKDQNGNKTSLGKTVTDNATKENLYNDHLIPDDEYQGLKVKKRIEYFLRFDYMFGLKKRWVCVKDENNFING